MQGFHTITSLERAGDVEVMGRDCGYLALMAGIVGGTEAVVILKMEADSEALAAELRAAYERGKAYTLRRGRAPSGRVKMKSSDKILKRQKYKVRFKNEDMDFVFNWLLGISELFGMSHGELFYVASQIKNESPHEWRAAFFEHAANLANSASRAIDDRRQELAAQQYLGAAYANKAALQFTDPSTPDYSKGVQAMESTFLLGAKHLGAPITPIDVPYHDTTLPGYYLKIDDTPRPTLIMIGGGDTGREDLFYFAGYPGWQRGYNVLMVDLPGQGNNPSRGLTFTIQTNEAVSASIDWLEKHDKHLTNIAIYGVSGGGYFTAQAVEHDKRIDAWIASTPIYDIAEVFRKEFGAALKTPGWLMNRALRLAGNLNESADINLKKYAWQFGTTDFATAVSEVLKQARAVDYDKISCPALLMMGENDAAELQRQTYVLYDSFRERGLPVTMRLFTAKEGADAHSQVNNFRLAHLTVFDWLDAIFKQQKLKQDIALPPHAVAAITVEFVPEQAGGGVQA